MRVLMPEEGLELRASSGQRYWLTTRLGGGRYSEVWEAKVVDWPGKLVAVKIMAPGLDDKSRKIFVREAYVLQALAQAEEKLDLRYKGQSLVPSVEAIVEDHEPPFFVESLAPGRPLDQILREQTLHGDKRIFEPDFLVIGEQLCRVFQALHDGLQRSHLDFQPRNVFWDNEAQRITVIDWNLLSPVGQVDGRNDLEAIARLLYRLAVGESVPSQGPHHSTNWTSLAAGTQAILTRALHPNYARRYQDAAKMRRDLGQQVEWWEQEAGSLLKKAAARLESVETQKNAVETTQIETDYRAVQQMLDIAKRKGADEFVLGQLSERVADGLKGSGSLGHGKALYHASDYSSAIEAFIKAKEKAVTLPEFLASWRWYLAAQIPGEVEEGSDSDPSVAADLVDTLSDWTEAEWMGSELDMSDIPPRPDPESLTSESLQNLANELDAWVQLKEARHSEKRDMPDDLRRAVAAYRQAEEIARSLPYGEAILLLWKSFEGLIKDLENRAIELEEAQVWQEKLAQAFKRNGREGVRLLGEALLGRPGDENLTKLALGQAQALLDQGYSDVAKDCLDTMLKDTAPRYLADPRHLNEVYSMRQAVLKQLEWQRKLDGVAAVIERSLEGENALTFPLIDTQSLGDELMTLVSKSKQADNQEMREAIVQTLSSRLEGERWEVYWRQAYDVLLNVAHHTPSTSPLRERGWELIRHALSSPAMPEWYQPLFLHLASLMAPSDTVEAVLRDELLKLKERRSTHKQIWSRRQAAQSMASTGLISSYEEALRELDQVLVLATQLRNKNLVAEVQAQRRHCEADYRKMQARALQDQVKQHQDQAEVFIKTGLLSKLPEALEELSQAIALAKNLDSTVTKTLERQKKRYTQLQEEVNRLLAGARLLETRHEWKGAFDLVKKVQDEYNITGEKAAGDIAVWLTKLVFEQRVAWFGEIYKQWESADIQQRKELVTKMNQVWQKLQGSVAQLDEKAQSRLKEVEKLYHDCCHQARR